MYALPLIVALIIALAIFFSPLLAVIVLVLALLGIGALKYLGGSSVVDQENAPAASGGQADVPVRGEASEREAREGGIWGETWPEQRQGRS